MATRTTKRQAFTGKSEFTGETRENTVPAKEAGAPLKNVERLRLIYGTGTEDLEAAPDRRAWLGFNPTPDSVIDFRD